MLKISHLGVWKYQEVSSDYKTTIEQIILHLDVDLAKNFNYLIRNFQFHKVSSDYRNSFEQTKQACIILKDSIIK